MRITVVVLNSLTLSRVLLGDSDHTDCSDGKRDESEYSCKLSNHPLYRLKQVFLLTGRYVNLTPKAFPTISTQLPMSRVGIPPRAPSQTN